MMSFASVARLFHNCPLSLNKVRLIANFKSHMIFKNSNLHVSKEEYLLIIYFDQSNRNTSNLILTAFKTGTGSIFYCFK